MKCSSNPNEAYNCFATKFVGSYERVIYWSKEDNCWVVEVPELPGCQADGATMEEALKNADVVIQEWLDTATSLGRPIPTPVGRYEFA